MKEWIIELCPEIAEWQAELIAEAAQNSVLAERAEVKRLEELCYTYLGELTALRAAKQMGKQIDAVKERIALQCGAECIAMGKSDDPTRN